MKKVEKQILKVVKLVARKQTIDPRYPECISFYHQPKRPKK